MNKFIIILSNEGDLMESLGENSFSATFDISQATKYDDENQAKQVIRDLGIKFLWNEARTQKI